ncbi:CpaD family pilus assembly protein [Sphingomonas hylomeconis]|uniref:CpaD family pilus assembly protein n=1 Tax=Sphingomonas hylomeconis TaxID=1395958 RepID=A0ABV7SYM5_9SPHN|nr:CpaD family pilus assembly protein [Sphingomonas hylomeconis]
MSTRNILIAATLAPALLIGACSSSQYRGLESAHQPVVSRADYLFDVATSGNALAPGERQRLAGWMQSINVGYGDRIAVDDPNAYGGPGVRDEVQAQAARYGLLVSDEVPVTGAPVAPGTVRVVVSRMKATVPHCPDFSRDGGTNFLGSTSSNHGCAVNSSLAAMIANPTDLVRGQPGADITDTAQANKAIDAYRKGGGVSPSGAASATGGAAGGSAGSGSSGGSAGGSSGGN